MNLYGKDNFLQILRQEANTVISSENIFDNELICVYLDALDYNLCLFFHPFSMNSIKSFTLKELLVKKSYLTILGEDL